MSIWVCLSEKKKKQKKWTPSKIGFLLKNIITGLNYDDFSHFWPPGATRGVWGAYVGCRGVSRKQIYFLSNNGLIFPMILVPRATFKAVLTAVDKIWAIFGLPGPPGGSGGPMWGLGGSAETKFSKFRMGLFFALGCLFLGLNSF